jgi:hypothetical protein
LQGRHGGEEEGDGDGRGLVEEAKRVWEVPGSVEVSVPVLGEGGGRRTVQVEVVSLAAEGEMGGLEQGDRDRGWVARPGQEVKVFGNVTFPEKWEREYQRTVQAKVERKKKGVLELSLSSMLWQAATAVQRGDELDQPS